MIKSFTAISYQEAANILDTHINNIRSGASREIITRIPSTGMKQYVIKEQIELFKNKGQIRLTRLSNDELKLWQHYKDLAENNVNNITKDEIINMFSSLLSIEEKKTDIITTDTNKEVIIIITIIISLIVLALGLKWYLDNIKIIDNFSELKSNINIDQQTSDKILSVLSQLDVNTIDSDTVSKIVLNLIAS